MYKYLICAAYDILCNNGDASPWNMTGKASIDDYGTIVTNLRIWTNSSDMNIQFTGGMYAQFMNKDGKILFITPLLQSTAKHHVILFAEIKESNIERVFRVDPSLYGQTTQIAIQLFHADKNQLGNDFTTVAPAIINNTVLLLNGVSGRKDVSPFNAGYALYSEANTNDKTKIIATWNHFKASSLPEKKPVTVYTDYINNKKYYQSFDVGDHDNNELVGNGKEVKNGQVGNDKISSIIVKRGYRVTLYEHENFKGDTCVITSDSSSLPDFDKKTSSLVVEHPAKEEVIVFADDNYRNQSQILSIGKYSDSDKDNFFENIKSLRIPYGYQVRLWEKTGCTGISKLLKSADNPIYLGDIPSLDPYHFDKKSLQVEFLKP